MAVAMNMVWKGVTAEQYDELRRAVNWENDTPEGGRLHVAWMEDDGLHIFDIWESPEANQAFVESRLLPQVMRLGIDGEQVVTFSEPLSIFAPNVTSTAS